MIEYCSLRAPDHCGNVSSVVRWASAKSTFRFPLATYEGPSEASHGGSGWLAPRKGDLYRYGRVIADLVVN
jgi:hypothetical protein